MKLKLVYKRLIALLITVILIPVMSIRGFAAIGTNNDEMDLKPNVEIEKKYFLRSYC